jgi:hypothetical protein
MPPQDPRNIDNGNAIEHRCWHDLDAVDDVGDFLRHVRLRSGDHHVFTARVPPPPFVEQLERLANARRVSKKDL